MKQVERARYEAELARRRYMQVDPDNRLVADVLEAEWNGKLKALDNSQEEYERAREADRAILDDEKKKQIIALATDFPRLWNNPKTPQRERKRMVRLLIEDVTLVRGRQITAHVRLKGERRERSHFRCRFAHLICAGQSPMWSRKSTVFSTTIPKGRLLKY
ncbi:MAG: hypothetical protein HYX78_05890 [Armatimonadetes bacterium]|nr:hypothetical protein [Armatimonadota bacterium]